MPGAERTEGEEPLAGRPDARGGREGRILLIYPFGASDLQRPRAPLQRGEPLAPFVDAVLQTDPDASWVRGALVWRGRDGAEVARMPILASTLAYIRGSVPGRRPIPVDLQPILTDQRPRHPQDTVALAPLLGRLDRQKFGRLGLHVLPAWRVRCDVSDFVAVKERYLELFGEYVRRAGAYATRLFQLAPGTPAMTFAAAVFSQDADLRFLYTPMRQHTRAMQLFAEERRRQTDELVATLAGRLEWDAVADALLQPGNGYMPLDGRPDRNPRLGEVWCARALARWGQRRYLAAARALETIGARGWGDRRAVEVLRRSCETLSETVSVRPPISWQEVWRWAMVDGFCRLLAAWHLDDLPGVIAALYTFNDACLLWAVTQGEPPGVGDLRRRADLSEEGARVRRLLALRDGGRLDREWASRYLALHWVLENGVDEVHDAFVRGGIHLPAGLLPARLRRLGLDHRGRAEVQRAFVAVAHSILDALPQRPQVTCPIAPLADAVGGAAPGPTLGSRWEEAASRAVATVGRWKEAREADLRAKEEQIRGELEAWVERFRARIGEELLVGEAAADVPLGSRPTRLSRWGKWAVRTLPQVLQDMPIEAEHVLHGLVPDRDSAYLEAIIASLGRNDGPFKSMVQLGSRDANLYQVRAWVTGEVGWDHGIASYVGRLENPSRRR
jgi:hypothetical protein